MTSWVATAPSSESGTSTARSISRRCPTGTTAGPSGVRGLRNRATSEQRPHRRREPDALQRPAGEPVEAFEGERQVAAALVAGERVDLVHDDGVGGREQLASAAGGEQQVERFRGGDQDVRRFPGHPGPLRGRGVAGAEFGAHRGQGGALPHRPGGDSGERNLEVPADVGAQRLQRGDVHHAGLVRKRPAPGLPGEPVQREEERGERLPRTRRSGDQHVLAPGDGRPPLRLGFGGRLETLAEPAGDGGVEAGERGGGHELPGRGRAAGPGKCGTGRGGSRISGCRGSTSRRRRSR